MAVTTISTILPLFVAVLSFNVIMGQKKISANLTDEFEVGDAKRCLKLLGTQVINFEVLPGTGWDNINNKEKGQVLFMNYSMCKLTNDGKYLIPDDVFVIPLKKSGIDMFAEVYDSMQSYRSVTSSSVNLEASFSNAFVHVSASFSDEHQTAKSNMAETKSVTTRVQARYLRYKTIAQPDSTLHPTFKARLHAIAESRLYNDSDTTDYLSQTLIRDFGTHVLNELDAGASLVKEDQVTTTSSKIDESEKKSLTIAAGASFHATFGTIGLSAAYNTKASDDDMQKYSDSTTHSHVKTYGGTYYRTDNFTADDWEKQLQNDLVAMDRGGEPIYQLITSEVLPELPELTVAEVQESVQTAFNLYYKMNAYRGCSNPYSKNFDIKVNIDDGTCDPSPPQQTAFGGVYQTCESEEKDNGDLCNGMVKPNPLTGDTSCPHGFTSIELVSWTDGTQRQDSTCKRHWFHKSCTTNIHESKASYTAYWCAEAYTEDSPKGFKFGGLYTSHRLNPRTGDHSCPAKFQTLLIGKDFYICVSDDDAADDSGIIFGGFFSCSVGNPLTLYLNKNSMDQSRSDITNFVYALGAKSWPKKCPDGFSQHLATNWNGCDVEFCTQLVTLPDLTNQTLPLLRRPPYMAKPPRKGQESSFVVLESNSASKKKKKSWKKNNEAFESMSKLVASKPQLKQYHQARLDVQSIGPAGDGDNFKDDDVLTKGAVAGISSAATLVCVVVATLVVIKCRRRRSRGSIADGNEDDRVRILSSTNNYGT